MVWRAFGITLLCVFPFWLSAHKLETGQAVLTISADRVWILELEVNLTRYIQSNPELADTVRPTFQTLEKEGKFTDENFDRWESVFADCEALFKKELEIQDSGALQEDFTLWFPHPSELPEVVYDTMMTEGLHVKINAAGRLVSDESKLQIRFPLDVGEVILTTIRPEAQWVVTGEWSDPIGLYGGGDSSIERQGIPIVRYLGIGLTHIVPKGLDHILFILGLFLLATKVRPLLIQVTAFTVAHTITLGLSMYGVFSLPSGVVEPLIALSITFVAVENVMTDTIHPWRPVVVFVFGLLHGLGFAGVLAEIGLPREEFLWALLSFNVGVELGQLVVLLTAFAVLGYFRKRNWYRTRLTVPASCIVGLVGLYWTIERVFF